MSTKRKQKQQDDNESKNVFDSFKKIFRGNPKINKLNRVVSHKPHSSPRTSSSLRRRPRSQSEPDLLSESLVLDSTDVKLETFITRSNQLFIDETPQKSKSFDNINDQLATTCPSKAAQRLGIDQDEPMFRTKTKEKKESFGGSNLKGRKSETGLRGSKRFSMKSKDKEPRENRVHEMEAVAMPANVSSKAAKTLGIEAVQVPSKAAKTLGITSHCDEQADKLTTEDFLRKIGAFASEKGKPNQKSLRKQATSPALTSNHRKSEIKSPSDLSTNALLRKLVQLSPTDQSRAKPSMIKTQSEATLAVSRKRRIETRSAVTVGTSSQTKLELSDEESERKCKEKTSHSMRPDKRTLPRPNSAIVSSSTQQSDCTSSKTLLITDHRTIKPAFLNIKDKHSNQSHGNRAEPSSDLKTDVHVFPRQLPALKTLQLDQKKLLKKCQSESRIAVSGK